MFPYFHLCYWKWKRDNFVKKPILETAEGSIHAAPGKQPFFHLLLSLSKQRFLSEIHFALNKGLLRHIMEQMGQKVVIIWCHWSCQDRQDEEKVKIFLSSYYASIKHCLTLLAENEGYNIPHNVFDGVFCVGIYVFVEPVDNQTICHFIKGMD